MVQSIANFTNFLQSEAAKEQQRPPSPASKDPASLVMSALREHGTVPLADVVTLTSLDKETALKTVETLRSMRRVEVFTFEGSSSDQLFLRLTPLGYAALAGLA